MIFNAMLPPLRDSQPIVGGLQFFNMDDEDEE